MTNHSLFSKHIVPMWTIPQANKLIDMALSEDLEGGDASTAFIVKREEETTARLVAKQDLRICGLPLIPAVFDRCQPQGFPIQLELCCSEGDDLKNGDTILFLKGQVHKLLAGERIILNFLQHLSGIATQARAFSNAVADLPTKVVDTRKTLPGWRSFQKYAVRIGGCFNHRYNLSSGVMLKENHIRAAGSISRAVEIVKRESPHTLQIEVEVTCLKEFEEARNAGADIIMLDNMSLDDMAAAVEQNAGKAILEASGNVTLESVAEIAKTGVDIISSGALTHSVMASDISMLVEI